MAAWEGTIKLTKRQVRGINETISKVDFPWTLRFIGENGEVLEERKGEVKVLSEDEFSFISYEEL